MNTQKISVDVPELKLPNSETRAVPHTFPTVNQGGFISAIIGSRGSSKTTKMCQMVLMYDKCNTFDHIVIFSPSLESDIKYKYLIKNLKADVETHDDFTTALFLELKETIKSRLEEYKQYQAYKKVYEKFLKYKGDLLKFKPDDLLLLYENFIPC